MWYLRWCCPPPSECPIRAVPCHWSPRLVAPRLEWLVGYIWLSAKVGSIAHLAFQSSDKEAPIESTCRGTRSLQKQRADWSDTFAGASRPIASQWRRAKRRLCEWGSVRVAWSRPVVKHCAFGAVYKRPSWTRKCRLAWRAALAGVESSTETRVIDLVHKRRGLVRLQPVK